MEWIQEIVGSVFWCLAWRWMEVGRILLITYFFIKVKLFWPIALDVLKKPNLTASQCPCDYSTARQPMRDRTGLNTSISDCFPVDSWPFYFHTTVLGHRHQAGLSPTFYLSILLVCFFFCFWWGHLSEFIHSLGIYCIIVMYKCCARRCARYTKIDSK